VAGYRPREARNSIIVEFLYLSDLYVLDTPPRLLRLELGFGLMDEVAGEPKKKTSNNLFPGLAIVQSIQFGAHN